jgi:hypothetical protein
MKQTFATILKDVDIVRITKSEIEDFFNEIEEEFDESLGAVGRDLFNTFLSSLEYHVNHALEYSYLDGTSEAARVAIDDLLIDSGVTRLPEVMFAVESAEEKGLYIKKRGRFNPNRVACVLDDGMRLVSGKVTDVCSMIFMSGKEQLICCSAKEIGEIMDRYDSPQSNNGPTNN